MKVPAPITAPRTKARTPWVVGLGEKPGIDRLDIHSSRIPVFSWCAQTG